MCNLSENVYESGIEKGIEKGANELMKAIQFIKEGSDSMKELNARGISDGIAEKALALGIK